MSVRHIQTPLFLIILLALCWSATPPLGRIAGQEAIPSFTFVGTQALGGMIILLLICAARKKWPVVSLSTVPFYLISGLFGQALPQLIVYDAVQNIPIAVVGLILALTPLATMAVAAAFRVETLTLKRCVALLMGFCGTLFVLLPKTALPSVSALHWVVLCLAVPVFFAFSNVFSVKLRPSENDTIGNALGMMSVATVFLFTGSLIWGQLYLPAVSDPSHGDITLAAQAAIAGLAYVLYFRLLDRAGAVIMSSTAYVILLLTTLWGALFFNELPNGWVIAAIILITGALLLLQHRPVHLKS
ncbi:MAG: DMT family transporter [Stappiaceae bacterium]